MSFQIPSHNNSHNERRARRANWKTDVRKNKNIVAELVALAKNNEVSKSENGYTVKTFLSTYEVTCGADGRLQCRCADCRNLGTCSHVIAAEMFAAALEAEKQAKIAVSRRIIRELQAVQPAAAAEEKCFWCHDADIATESGELVACAFCDRAPSEDFHYQAGETELHYENTNYWEAA